MKDDPIRPFPHPASASSVPAAGEGGLDLKSAVRRARIEEAERSSVAAELRGAEMARLEMLQETLQPVFAQLPRDAELFDMGLIPGEKPRLFVDMVAFVEMARDRRTFRFIQETRSGRILLAENDKVDPLAEAVTAYLGRRLVERERALAQGDESPAAAASLPAPLPDGKSQSTPGRRYGVSDMVFAVVLGMIVGATLLLLAIHWKAQGVQFLSSLRFLP